MAFGKLPIFSKHAISGSVSLSREIGGRDERWSEAIAVGDFTFVQKVKSELGFKALHCRVMEVTGT